MVVFKGSLSQAQKLHKEKFASVAAFPLLSQLGLILAWVLKHS